jgi:membrane protease YdiL (CAAX protease family)
MKGYIQQAFNGYTNWWRYLLGFLFIFFIWQLGATIQIGVVLSKLANEGYSLNEALLKVADVDVIMNTLESNLNFFLLLLGFAFGFGAIFIVVKFFHNLDFKDILTTRANLDWKRIFFGASLISIVILISTLLDYWLNPNDYLLSFKFDKFIILALIGIVMVPIQTTFEELLFRGYFMQGLGSVFKSKAVALILSSVIFGLLHIANPEVAKLGYQALIVYIGTGFFFGIMTLMDEGMELAIGFHAANNLLTALLVTADWTAFKTYSVFTYLGEPSVLGNIYIPVFIVYPILIFFLARKYKWNNWKERLFGKVVPPQIETQG